MAKVPLGVARREGEVGLPSGWVREDRHNGLRGQGFDLFCPNKLL
jgi:hypothetical protein